MQTFKISVLLGALSLACFMYGAPATQGKETTQAKPAQAKPAQAKPVAKEAPKPAPAPKVKSIQEQIADLQAQIDELNDRSDEIELKAELSKVKFGLDFTTALNNFVRTKDVAGEKWLANNWAMALYLNMNANINKRVHFTGRLSVTKNFGDYDWTGINYTTMGGTLSAGKDTIGGPVVFLERAYADVHILLDRLIVTVGRQPGTEGPGSNLRSNSARMSTYPALMVNALGDGIVLTYKPWKNSPSGTAIRVGWSKIYQNSTAWNDPSVAIFPNKVGKEANFFYVGAETKLPLGKMGDNLLMIGYVKVTNFMAANALKQNPTLNVMLANHSDMVNVGNPDIINLHFENNNAFGLGTNWFVSVGIYNGSPTAYAPIASMNSMKLSLYDGVAWALHAGIRQDFGEYFKLGYEFFHGSEGWYAFSRANINDPLNFRNTQGFVHDMYLIAQFSRNSFLRASYTYQQHDYLNTLATTAGAGIPYLAPVAAKRVMQNIALSFNVRF